MPVRVHTPVLIVAGMLLESGFGVIPAQALKLAMPADFGAVEANVDRVEADIAGAQCGGWDEQMSVRGKIPVVTGAPGRRGIVFSGDQIIPQVAQSGLALREEESGARRDGYVFPDSGRAEGFSTVCSPGQCGNSFPYQNACIPGGGGFACNNPVGCRTVCNEMNQWTKIRYTCAIHWLDFDANGNPFPVDAVEDDTSPCRHRATGDWCQPENNGWQPVQWEWDNNGWRDEFTVSCAPQGEFYCCSDQPFDDASNANCIACSGDGLEDPATPGQDNNGETIANLQNTGCRQGKPALNGRSPYRSFYRRYLVSYSRDSVQPHVPNDDAARTDVPVDCFCPYEEFDPKLRRTSGPDRRCMINAEDPSKGFSAMVSTQIGKGNYGQEERLSDPAFPLAERDTLRDLWINDFSGAFSLLNGPKLSEQTQDTHFPLLALDAADLRATPQLDAERLYSTGNLLRSTDDTVSNQRPGRRTIAEWWQEQETQAHKLFTAPVLRLILPTPTSIGLDLSDPLLTPSVEGADPSAPLSAQHAVIDLQIRTEPEDLLSQVSAYLERGLLLRIREESVPLAVPLASPVELRALAQGWLRWGEFQGPGEAQTKAFLIAEKLEHYAERAEDARALRAELAQYVGRLIQHQSRMTAAIAQWLQHNERIWKDIAKEEDERSALKPLWESVQQQYRVFHDQANMPWCRNDRYTTPIYSLLDTWMPGPSPERDLQLNLDVPATNDAASVNDLLLPRMAVAQLPDLVYDFTALRVATGAVLLPVLKPIQIQLSKQLLDPPPFYAQASDTAVSARLERMTQLPDLPPVPTVFEEVRTRILPADLLQPASPSNAAFALPRLSPSVEPMMRQMLRIFEGMTETYGTFWESVARYGGPWECRKTGTLPCVHVEMDLLERFTRIGARPLVQLKEDFASRGAPRRDVLRNASAGIVLPSASLNPPTAVPPCPREDWACQVFNAEKTFAREGWRVEGVEEDAAREDLSRLRNRLRDATLPAQADASLYPVPPADILPSYNVPGPLPISGGNAAPRTP